MKMIVYDNGGDVSVFGYDVFDIGLLFMFRGYNTNIRSDFGFDVSMISSDEWKKIELNDNDGRINSEMVFSLLGWRKRQWFPSFRCFINQYVFHFDR